MGLGALLVTVQGLLPSHEQEPYGVSPASQVLHVEFIQRLVAVNPVQGLPHGKAFLRDPLHASQRDCQSRWAFPRSFRSRGRSRRVKPNEGPLDKSRQASSPTPGRARTARRSEAEQRPDPPQWDSGCVARLREVAPPNGSSQACKIYTLTLHHLMASRAGFPLAPQQD